LGTSISYHCFPVLTTVNEKRAAQLQAGGKKTKNKPVLDVSLEEEALSVELVKVKEFPVRHRLY
jgi:hypothetical protein